MRLAILYTSYRQWRELDYLPEMFRRLPVLPTSCDIIYHNNNSALAKDLMAEKLARIPCASMDFIYSPQKNEGGYPYGQFEAIDDAWHRLECRFDWVIHLHPDVFVLREEPLLAAIREADHARADLLVTPTFGLRAPSFATDFFAFRPIPSVRPVFASYRNLAGTDIVVPLENLFFVEVHRARLKYVVAHRYAHGHYHRDIDQLGLWHEHNLIRMDLYLKKPWRRWLPTVGRCARRPYRSLRFILNWAGRKWKGVPQESLARQLTAI
jgi:hypothetical protein